MTFPLAIAWLPGCADVGPGAGDTAAGGYLYHETGDAPDTDTADTADTDDSAADDPPESVAIFPKRMVVMPGATWTYRAVGTWADGRRADLAIEGIVEAGTIHVEDGVAVAVATGDEVVTFAVGPRAATTEVLVRDESVAEVTVVNALDGSPIAGALVALPLTPPLTVDQDGFGKLAVPDSGPQQITAWKDEGWSAVTIAGTLQRRLTIALTPRDGGGFDSAIAGTVDWSSIPAPEADELAIGLAGASLPRALATLDIDGVFAENRTVTIFGTDVSAPANLFVKGYVEDWTTAAMAGPAAAWGLAGIVKTEDALALGSAADALAMLGDEADGFDWGVDVGLVCTTGGTTEGRLSPTVALGDEISLELPEPPLGLDAGDDWFLATAEQRDDEGWIVTGIGAESAGPATLAAAPEGSVPGARARAVLAVAQAGGIGSGQGTTAVVAEVGQPFPVPLALPSITDWNPETRALAASAEGADFLLLRLVDKKHHVHEVVAPGAWDGTMPAAIDEMARGQATLYATAAATMTGHFEDWVRDGDVDPGTKDTVAVARNRREP